MRLITAGDNLPASFDVLRAAARAEGMAHLDRLAAAFAGGEEKFVPPARLLLAEDGALLGCGGITRDPDIADALRMRRFYVLPRARGRGIGRAIAEALLAGVPEGTAVVLNAGYAGARAFWERLGFVADAGAHHTHRWRPR